MKKRSLKVLTTSMTFDEFKKFCIELAEDYAKTDLEYARSYYCRKYNLTQACYYKILEYAAVNNWVDDDTFERIMHKSACNQKYFYLRQLQKEGIDDIKGMNITSIAKYNRLYEQRCRAIASSWPAQKIAEIAIEYSENKKSSKYKISIQNKVSPRVIDYVIELAIKQNLVSGKIRAKILLRDEKAMQRSKSALKFKI